MICIILRGLPGSGKSTFAKLLLTLVDWVVISADNFFINKGTGAYNFDKRFLFDAHQICYNKFIEICNEGKLNVVVDNTNTTTEEYKKYETFAISRGYKVYVLEVHTDLTDAELSDRNVHRVPVEAISRMRSRLNG